ncbi:hypothetical protein ACRAWD_30195 [Caulobacter segnis]
MNRNLKLQVELVHQAAGPAVRALGGRAVDLAVLFAQVRLLDGRSRTLRCASCSLRCRAFRQSTPTER